MARLNLSPPWDTCVRELEQLFKYDSEVHVVYDENAQEVKIYVDAPAKAEALTLLLPKAKEFANVVLTITVIPANGTVPVKTANLFPVAFKGNGAFSFSKTVRGIFSNDLTYVVFKNKVVQYFSDNLGDVYGQTSTLYQEIAKDIFEETEGVCFCTDVEDPVYKLGSPLGEWP